MTDPTPQQILDVPLPANDSGATTVRGYLIELLAALWRQGSGFSGKRPFGNSSWEYDLYDPLVRAELAFDEFDEFGEVAAFDRSAAPHLAAAVDGLGRQLAEMARRDAPPECTCPGGLPDGWRSDFDPDCLRHGIPETTDDEIRALLPAARSALGWAVGARTGAYRDDPHKTHDDGMLVNIIISVLAELRTPAEVKELP